MVQTLVLDPYGPTRTLFTSIDYTPCTVTHSVLCALTGNVCAGCVEGWGNTKTATCVQCVSAVVNALYFVLLCMIKVVMIVITIRRGITGFCYNSPEGRCDELTLSARPL